MVNTDEAVAMERRYAELSFAIEENYARRAGDLGMARDFALQQERRELFAQMRLAGVR